MVKINYTGQWAGLICLSSAVCVIIDLILPSGNMEKPLRIVLALFLLTSMLFPLSEGIPDFKIKIPPCEKIPNQTEKFIKSMDKQFKSLAKQNLKNIIKEILKDLDILDIKDEKIQLSMDTNEDGCISISKCKVYIPKNCKNKSNKSQFTDSEILKIKKELEKRLNIETEVIIMN